MSIPTQLCNFMRLHNLRVSAAVIGLTLLTGTLSVPAFAINASIIANTNIIALVRWTLDKAGATFKQLTPAEQRNFDTFQNAIAKEGLSPKDAASRIGGANYKRLQGTKDQYEIRLSKGTRATFLVNDKNHVVKILEVGGHT